jgi:hypothetical protein
MAQPMGLGLIGGNNVIFKRKFRWTFKVAGPSHFVDANWVKLASRPNLSVEETEINFLNGKMFIPGKGTWETITVTYYDLEATGGGGVLNGLFQWLASVFDFTDPINLFQSSKPNCYGTTCVLQMYDGCGNSMETWTLSNTWPNAINFGELDYSSSEEATIELTLRFSAVKLVKECGGNFQPIPCCGCTTA